MKISEAGLDLIREHEGCRLEAYRDSVGVLTLGYGHTRGVKAGDTCTPMQADEWLREDIHHAETCVDKCVSVPLTQGEFDALVSFAVNLGCGALRGSTLLRLVNDGRMDDAAEQFGRWNHAGGIELAGLTARRKAEQELFET